MRALGSLATCLLLLLACSKDPEQEGYSLVYQDLPAALMSVSGTSAEDVWMVGADMRDGSGAFVLHYDGDAMSQVSVGVEADLWWVQAFAGGRLHMSGGGGTFVVGDGDSFEALETPGIGTAYGTWGATQDDVWIVGGDPGESPGFLWHYDGQQVRDATAELGEDLPALFKVFGLSADDVYIVGMDGAAFHYDGADWSAVNLGTDRRVFTVHGAEGRYVAVGGFGSALVVENDGDGFALRDDVEAPQLYGVFMTSAEEGYAVGSDGVVLHRDASGFSEEDLGMRLYFPFHAVWVDDDGGVWAVGGDVETPALNRGMVLHRGAPLAGPLLPL